MPLPVVVGIDGSASSLRAVDWAADEAHVRGVPLRLLHTSLWDRYEPDASDNPDLALARKAVAELVDTASERAGTRRPGVEVRAEVVPQATVPALLEAACEASVLVVGDRGRGGFAGLLLGSTGLQTAARAACPVVVVRGGDDAVDRRHGRVVLGVGDPGSSRAAAEFALDLAETWGARLEAVHAWHSTDPFLLYGPAMNAMADAGYVQARRMLEAATADAAAAHPGVLLRLEPRNAGSHKALLEAAADADLLVVGARRRHSAVGLQLGPVNHAVLHHAPCPVAVVPEARTPPPAQD
ncbi:universal stress protein [Streptacidiphilus sp. ASG 303]|uniref:universal stress protein n=1 Tax=Streptacidiphilus sp. ASG 303 TaxID=2896847 RepID=UPI001E4E4D42|nr:universal stress protein [Streptacidiphilus sp. ASG 303]MCD0484500.1 universal stress protein [Streptacidiphilus sp. ASG 303]